mgnify:CR=1 FL=1
MGRIVDAVSAPAATPLVPAEPKSPSSGSIAVGADHGGYRLKERIVFKLRESGRVVVDKLRDEGMSVGLVKVKLFRPFPFDAIRKALAGRKLAIVFDRNLSYGHHGIFAQEIKSALYGTPKAPPVTCYVGGLGGKDITPELIEGMVRGALNGKKTDELFAWV